MKHKSPFLIQPHRKVRLARLSTTEHPGFHGEDAAHMVMHKHRKQLDDLQDVFYASQAKALLIVLQGMDTAGKDGTIRHIFSGINPQGCDVASFKVPTPVEARHYFLWRCQIQTPARGMIEIFNRSHYEDVLSPRVHGHIDSKTAHKRMDDINDWEESLANNDVIVLKFFSTSPTRSRPAASSPASTRPTSTGSSRPPTSRSAASGRLTSTPTKTSSAAPAANMRLGSSSRRTINGSAT